MKLKATPLFCTVMYTCIFAAVLFLVPKNAKATWLGLSDGTYNVTLDCLTLTCPTPDPLVGTMTVSGSGVTNWDFMFTSPSLTFSGDPDDLIAGSGFEYSAGYAGSYRLEIENLVPGQYWFIYDPAGSAAYGGSWLAKSASIPEPESFLLLGFGLAGLAAWGRRKTA